MLHQSKEPVWHFGFEGLLEYVKLSTRIYITPFTTDVVTKQLYKESGVRAPSEQARGDRGK